MRLLFYVRTHTTNTRVALAIFGSFTIRPYYFISKIFSTEKCTCQHARIECKKIYDIFGENQTIPIQMAYDAITAIDLV